MTTPTELITSAQQYAQDVIADALTAMERASAAAGAVTLLLAPITPAVLPSQPPSSIDLQMPVFDPVELALPTEPGAGPTYQDIGAMENVDFPTFSETAPTLNMPNKPTSLEAFSGVLPDIETDLIFPEMPPALSDPFPREPTIPDREEPTAPTVMLPSFDAIAPVNTAVLPTDHQARFESAYAGAAPSMVAFVNGYVDDMLTKYNPRYFAQMAAIEDQIALYMAGGTGLNPAVEDAIYTRSRSKADAETRRVQDANWADAAARGFTLPTGALNAGNQTARQAAADINATAAREIVVMQAEMEQKNLQFAVTTSIGLRSTLLNATLAYMQNLTTINGQALDYAKTVLSAIIEVYNSAVKAFAIAMDAYKAEASVYEVKIRGAMASIELYKAEIDALQAMTQVDKAKIDVYRARIDSLNAYASIWKTQIEAVLGQVNLEKLKVDLFQSLVQSYTAMVQGKNAEWNGYEAAINGEMAKVKIHESKVNAYSAEVNGARAKVEGLAEVIRSSAVTNQAKSNQYLAQIQGYKAIVDARGDVAKLQVDIGRQELTAFQAQVQYEVENAKLLNEWYRSTSNVAIENNKVQLESSRLVADLAKTTSVTLAGLAEANAKAYSGLASSAMSGMNSLAASSETV